MKILATHPGASWSTADVFHGIRDAMIRQNVEVHEYALDGRLEKAGGWLKWLYRHRADKDMPHPTQGDLTYAASKDITERALWHECEWVLCVAVGFLHPQALILARRAGLKVAILFTESPNEDAGQFSWAKLADVCWVNERTSVDRYREVNPHSYYWQHAIDPSKHHPGGETAEDVAAHDVVLVGTGWQERCDLLNAIDWTGIDLGLYGTWPLLGSRSKLRKYIRGGVTPNELTAALYRRAKIGLNLHRTSVLPFRKTEHISSGESMNPRCYELAACGSFFITDERAEVRETFGDAVPTFRTPDELEAQIRYWLAHDAERQERAALLPGLVADCTFDNRIAGMLDILRNYHE